MILKITRPTDQGSTIVNGSAIATIQIVKLLTSTGQPDQFSLILTLAGQTQIITIAETNPSKGAGQALATLIATRDDIWKSFTQDTKEVTGTDLPDLKPPP
jgi:hypothetical protein